jgi:hypothetical protein
MLSVPLNPNGRPNSDVVKRRLIGRDVVRRNQDGWLIDFGEMSEAEAALYEQPFEYVRKVVKPLRDKNRDRLMNQNWWLHGRSRPALRCALVGLQRCIVTPEVAKHRIFVWMSTDVVPDKKLNVIARGDDYFFGVLHSRAHELWALSLCSTLEDRPSYNSERTFDTFPLARYSGVQSSATIHGALKHLRTLHILEFLKSESKTGLRGVGRYLLTPDSAELATLASEASVRNQAFIFFGKLQ